MASPRKRKLRKLARIKKTEAAPEAAVVDTPPPLPDAGSDKKDDKAPEKAKKAPAKKSDDKTKK